MHSWSIRIPLWTLTSVAGVWWTETQVQGWWRPPLPPTPLIRSVISTVWTRAARSTRERGTWRRTCGRTSTWWSSGRESPWSYRVQWGHNTHLHKYINDNVWACTLLVRRLDWVERLKGVFIFLVEVHSALSKPPRDCPAIICPSECVCKHRGDSVYASRQSWEE